LPVEGEKGKKMAAFNHELEMEKGHGRDVGRGERKGGFRSAPILGKKKRRSPLGKASRGQKKKKTSRTVWKASRWRSPVAEEGRKKWCAWRGTSAKKSFLQGRYQSAGGGAVLSHRCKGEIPRCWEKIPRKKGSVRGGRKWRL